MSIPMTPNLSLPVLDLRPDRTKSYHPPKPILDRILVRRIEAAKSEDAFAVPEKYRQQTNRGEVIAIGNYVALGNTLRSVEEFVQVGDIVHYGEFTAEQDKNDPSVYIVRIQDVRLVEKLVRE